MLKAYRAAKQKTCKPWECRLNATAAHYRGTGMFEHDAIRVIVETCAGRQSPVGAEFKRTILKLKLLDVWPYGSWD